MTDFVRSGEGNPTSPPLEFTVLGVPQPAGSKKAFAHRTTGRIVVTDAAKNSRPWKNTVAAEAILARNGELLQGPLALTVHFYFPRPKGHHNAKGVVRPSAPQWPAVRPDTTKLLRAVEDACNQILWRDDAQIVHQTAVKRYGEPARAEITIQPL